jgi:diguanylate cyclase (GGDEF)-like protein
MALDIPTFVLMGAFMMLLCGALLITAYFYFRDAPAALWWGISQVVIAGGVVTSLTGGITGTDWITAVAFILFLTAASTQWHGTRLLTGSHTHLGLLLAGPLLMVAVNFLPLGTALPAVRGMTAMLLNVGYFGGAIYVLLRPPAGRLAAYKPLAILFVANIAAIGLAPFGGLGSTAGGLPPLVSLVGLLHLEGQIFAIAATFFVVAALRERTEADQRHAAGTDPLTGLCNRRSFFEDGGRLIDAAKEGTPISVVLIDLDHFKSVNDRFGHAMGDQVLHLFAETARKLLRPNDVLARMGGEEFAAILRGSTQEAAYVITERMRRAFEEAAAFVDGQPINATLSAGVATALAPASLDELLRNADAALYVAKQNGRNRVECMVDKPANDTATSVTRIA